MLYDVVVTRPFDKVFTYSSTNEQLKNWSSSLSSIW